MGMDFTIKPVGAPVAMSFAQPAASNAVSAAIPTQLPASQSVTVVDTDVGVRNDGSPSGGRLSHQVTLDNDAGSLVFQVVDNKTGAVVKQFPDEAMLRRKAYFRALDLSQMEHTKMPITDLNA